MFIHVHKNHQLLPQFWFQPDDSLMNKAFVAQMQNQAKGDWVRKKKHFF